MGRQGGGHEPSVSHECRSGWWRKKSRWIPRRTKDWRQGKRIKTMYYDIYIYRYSLVQSLLLDTFWSSFNIQKDPTIITSQATQGPPMGPQGKPKRSSKLCVFCLKVFLVKSMLLQKWSASKLRNCHNLFPDMYSYCHWRISKKQCVNVQPMLTRF